MKCSILKLRNINKIYIPIHRILVDDDNEVNEFSNYEFMLSNLLEMSKNMKFENFKVKVEKNLNFKQIKEKQKFKIFYTKDDNIDNNENFIEGKIKYTNENDRISCITPRTIQKIKFYSYIFIR